MATHYCIANPCWICYPQLKPKSLEDNYSNDLQIAIEKEREMIYHKLYSRDSKDKIRVWFMEQRGNKYRTTSGIDGGAMVTAEWTTVEGKNIGRSNETSSTEQATKEIEAKYKDQMATGYFDAINDIDTQLYFEPMLAKKYEDYKNAIEWDKGVYVSGKLDGLRCIIHKKGMFSRNGKPIISAPHIFNSLKSIFDIIPSLILDSELYCDRLSNDFNKIISLAKKSKPTKEDLIESELYLQAWVFDMPSFHEPFAYRRTMVQKILKDINSPYLRYINHKQVRSHEQIEKALQEYLELGLEGVMVNLGDYQYENKRSKGLMKYKKFQDCEAKICDIVEGTGNRSKMFGYAKLKLSNGKAFDSNARGNEELYRSILKNKDKYIGRMATVRFQNLTPDGVPRFPVIVDFDRFD
jgi:ATP-dependent DNA ligase